jgi:hypothetical protein
MAGYSQIVAPVDGLSTLFYITFEKTGKYPRQTGGVVEGELIEKGYVNARSLGGGVTDEAVAVKGVP